jgi:hypothetical protein
MVPETYEKILHCFCCQFVVWAAEGDIFLALISTALTRQNMVKLKGPCPF